MSSAQDSSNSALKTAEPPFNKPSADVIIRTSDAVDFFVSKAIIGEASPVFDGMFGLSLPTAPTQAQGTHEQRMDQDDAQLYRDGIPIAPVTEPSEVIDILLRFCYPVAPPSLNSAKLIFNVLEAARKYVMESLADHLHTLFLRHAKIAPFEVYALSASRQWKKEMKRAAMESLRLPFPVGTYIPEMDGMNAKDYVLLQKFHDRCRRIAGEKLIVQEDNAETIYLLCDSVICPLDLEDDNLCFFTGCSQANRERVVVADEMEFWAPPWLIDYLLEVQSVLQQDPRREALTKSDVLARYIGVTDGCCAHCQSDAREGLRRLQRNLGEDFAAELSKVSTSTRVLTYHRHLQVDFTDSFIWLLDHMPCTGVRFIWFESKNDQNFPNFVPRKSL